MERRSPCPARYQIRIAGQLDEAAAEVFAGMDSIACGSATVLSGELDQAGLHGVLERIRSLRLELIVARRVRGSPARKEARNMPRTLHPGEPDEFEPE